ncbi:5-oxoprolinase subunit PxpB [Aureimonas populi]|uniref:5-oxoprolinase subunit PxpB n=1 Tax=Aureimonas populi TaxID=1701758 RepID=A0ABW5CNJ6_9HYPH|nr:5-oxoprolinase subunit PxpB [Aureimonas populi]
MREIWWPAEGTPSLTSPRIASCGESAVTVEFCETIDKAANRLAVALAQSLSATPLPGIDEVVPTYRSLLVTFDPIQTDMARIARGVTKRLATLPVAREAGREISVPVLYEGEACLDLSELAAGKGMTTDALVELHLSAEYEVAMIGFAPGFAYLSGLPEPLRTPRRAIPRQRVPEGAIGIGGVQASVSSVAGPSGWHFIGQTPLRLFAPERAAPFLLEAGDRIRFRRIERAEFDAIRLADRHIAR